MFPAIIFHSVIREKAGLGKATYFRNYRVTRVVA